MRSSTFVVCAVLLFGMASYAVGQPTFSLEWLGKDRVEGAPGAAVEETYTAQVTTGGDPDGEGAQGWSLSLTASGCDLTGVSTADTQGAPVADGGLQNGGFEKTELTVDALATNPAAGCPDDSNGGVSAVVLSFTMPITLPFDAPQDILKATVSAAIPELAPQECETCELFFLEDCTGSGQPVQNNFTWRGTTIKPDLASKAIALCVEPPSVECPREGEDGVQLVIQSEVVSDAGFDHVGETADLFAGLADTPDPEQPAQLEFGPGAATVYAAIVSQGISSGVQGWSLSAEVAGNMMLTGVSTVGTAGGDVGDTPAGKRNGGFEKSELTVDALATNPAAGCPGGADGVVSAVVLSFTMPITLEPVGTATVLGIAVEGNEGDTGTVEWVDNCAGSGQPVQSVATIGGGTEQYLCRQDATVAFVAPEVSDILRCDANADSKVNIADAVWIISELFYGGLPTACAEASDCNDDGMTDISDAVYNISYRFDGESAPPGPGFPNCQPDPDSTVDSCPAGSTSCP